MTTTDKRRHERHTLAIGMSMTISGREARRCQATIADLSQSGMTLETEADLAVGEALHLKSDLPLELRGEILNKSSVGSSRTRRYGVRLHHIGNLPNRD